MNPAAPVTTYRTRGAYRPRRSEPVKAGVADAIEAIGVGDDRRVLAVGKRPHLLAGEPVERIGATLERREVDTPCDDRRRARDGAVRLELPAHVARGRVDRVEVTVVGPCVHGLAPDGRRGVDV